MNSSISDLQDEAAEWLVRLDAGTADTTAFEAWRAEPRHAVAFALAQAAWDGMGETRAAGPVSRPSTAREPLMTRRRLLRAASVAAPVLAVGAGVYGLAAGGRAYAATAVGERSRFEAVAGLTVELNTDSGVRWRKSGRPCELWLERGEAAILVEGASTGAILHCGEHRLLLSPGLYNIRARPVGGDLTVLEGAARTGPHGAARASRIATGGERIVLGEAASRVERAPSGSIEAISAWRRGEIVFDGQRLSEAVAEYNRYLEQKLVIEDASIASRRIGGRFETLRPRSFLVAVEAAFDLKAVPTRDSIILRKKSPAE